MTKVILIAFCLILYTAGNVPAVEISWMHIQHREYGNGKSLDRLGFGLIDGHGNYIRDNRSVKDVKLYGLENREFKLAPLNFNSVEEIYGTYDSRNSQWLYSKAWQFDSWFNTEVIQPLIPGRYRLKVTTSDGSATERAFTFHKRIELPIIDSDTLRLRTDAYGNLIWTWSLPLELGQLALNYKTRARASIDIFKHNKNVGYFSIILPVHLAYVVIPADVAQTISQKGDRFEFKVQIETKDKNNRTYSKPLTVGEIPSIPHNKL